MKSKKNPGEASKVIDFREHHQVKQKKLQRRMSYGALIVLAVVVVSFVAWPILSNGAGGNESISLGSYRGEPINYSSEYGLFNNNLNSALNQPGSSNFDDDYQRRGLFEQAFFSTVGQYGRYFFLRDRGNDVSRREANSLIYKQFSQDGKFDRSAWNKLQNDPNRLKDAQNIMSYAAAQNIWADIYGSVDLIDGAGLELLVPTPGDVRKVSYLYHKISAFPEAEVEKFYDKNSKLFQKKFLSRIVVDSKANRKKVEAELTDGGDFGELAQLYSGDVYSQDKGEYGNEFYYKMLDFFRDMDGIDEEKALEWTKEVFGLEGDEYAGPYELDKQWYFFRVKSRTEIAAEEEASEDAKDANGGGSADGENEDGGNEDGEAADNAEEEPLTGFAAVASVVRDYIEENEVSLITDYFRKNLETLKARAESGESLAALDQSDRDVNAGYGRTPEFFGFSYSGEDGSSLYDPISGAFTEEGLAALITKSKPFFEDIFSLEEGELSDVMLFGEEDDQEGAGYPGQKYVAFFRLEEVRQSNVNDFARNVGGGLESKESLFNYYLSSLLTGGTELEFLNNRNLKQRFDSAYNTWSSGLPQN
ncbi:peptidylprolyl isomerase [Candidatus Haliotispira prima]|uniref:Peptidylprolyl isomerase n=1 Tax=Candidatus Haliotispira prima TaxID=3034016 RepID=A0ABY8MIL7_9SPIO|nr:peptidylprolyl isomerase [Candidatus Haliotispira prima]